ncbi:hypothetical protein GO986_08610 [Deinococcus sp. HMF7620]|uniref:Uncharacterized protein n=1 Tax=Deinococcus arboris TaxID=2682977 RepID=A0A7C9M8C0_9DEIO|nr:hypothetical protein [Deinococcus arboris]MVN86823.1 hypothetical protein [Deinococcus arboris]
MARSKKELVEAIAAAGGETLNPDDHTAAELEAKLDELEAQAEEVATITVKVNPDKGSGSYLHPESKTAIERGGKAVEVPDDAWTQDMVAKRFLLEVRK